MSYFDKHQIWCLVCKHCWILGSDKYVEEERHRKWVKEVLIAHGKVHKEGEK